MPYRNISRQRFFTADIMAETVRRSSLKNATSGDFVNLERAMAADGRFGGHIVSGHVDGTGTILSMKKRKMQYGLQYLPLLPL